MAVEMIGREIQKHADVGAKRVDEFELKAAELDDGASIVFHRVDAGDERRADISRENGWNPGRLQNVFDERSRRRLSVRTGDSDQRALEEAIGQLDFAPNRDAFGARRSQMRFIGRHAGTGNNQVLLEKGFLAMAAEFEGHARVVQFARSLRQSPLRCENPSRSRARHAPRKKATVATPVRASPTTSTRFPRNSIPPGIVLVNSTRLQMPCYLNFSVVSANSAKTSATIQNRTMTFDSLQPSNSK